MKTTITIPELKTFLDEMLKSGETEKLIELIDFLRLANPEQKARIRIRLDADHSNNAKILSAALLLTDNDALQQIPAVLQIVRKILREEPNNIIAIHLLAHLCKTDNSLLNDTDFFGQRKPDDIYEQLAILYRRSLSIQRNSRAVREITKCIMQGVEAKQTDFADGKIPTNRYEMEAKLVRAVLMYGRDVNALLYLSSLMLKKNIPGLITDFPDGELPDTHNKQALKLLREILSIKRPQNALIALAGLLYFSNKDEIKAEPGDFLDVVMPVERNEQVAKLFREVIQKQRDDCAIYGLAVMIMNEHVIAIVDDFVGDMPDTPSEQAAKLFREILQVRYRPNAVMHLAKMIEKSKVIALASDFFDGVIPGTPALQAAKLQQQYLPTSTAETQSTSSASTATSSTDNDTTAIVQALKKPRTLESAQFATSSIAVASSENVVLQQSESRGNQTVASELRKLSMDRDPQKVRERLSQIRKEVIESSAALRKRTIDGLK